MIKKMIVLPLMLLFTVLQAQVLEGSWMLSHQNGKPVTDQENVRIYQDGYFSFGIKETGSNKFIGAGGGEYSLRDNKYTESYDFYTLNSEKVGHTHELKLDMSDGKMVISSETNGQQHVEIWERISDNEDALTGNWVITGRIRNGETSRSIPGARRTVKILSGGRFQWIAFNSDTKEFSGSGGGRYSAIDGKYVENIEFFSRDDNRVGASLEFNFEIIDGEWHHSGLSSTGNPNYEIWTKYKDAYKPDK